MKPYRTYLISFWIIFSLMGTAGFALAQPTVNLGPDLLSCDSVMLDAGNAGASYLWSTGASSQAITVNQTGIYWVDVTDVSGTSRDSILVEIQSPPSPLTLPSVDLCGPQSAQLNPDSLGDYVIWFDDSVSGNVIDVIAPSVDINSDTSFFAKNYVVQFGGNGGIENKDIFASGGFTSIRSGYAFDALQDLIIDSVAVYVNTNATLQIQLWDDQNNVLVERIVQVQAPDKYFVDLSIFVPAGNNYKLMLISISGGLVLRNGNAAYPYPFQIPASLSINRHTTNGNNTVSTFSSVFYDWHISTLACESPWFTQDFQILPIPSLTLKSDTVACGLDSVELVSGNNPGASYLWSTGDTTESIIARQDGNYKVSVALNPACPIEDSIQLTLLADVNLDEQQIAICGPQVVPVNFDSLDELVLIYRDSMATEFLDARSINADVSGDTTFYIRGYNALSAGRVGIENDSIFVTGGFTNIRTGYAFDVFQDMVLDSVAVYANVSSPLTIQLWDSNNVVLGQRDLIVPGTGKQFLDLTFFIPKGNNYKLMLTAMTPGRLFRNGNDAYPYPFVLPDVMSITRHTTNGNNTVTSFSSVFYDWHVSLPLCESGIEEVNIFVADIPEITLNEDTLVCGFPSINLIAGNNPAASYSWSTGDTTEVITVDSTGIYKLSAFIVSQCPVEDSIQVFLLDAALPPSDSLLEVCNPQEVTLSPQTNSDVLLWYVDSSSTMPFATQDLTVDVSTSLTYLTRTLNAANIGRVGIENTTIYTAGGLTNLVSGNAFDAFEDLIIDSILVNVNNPTDISLQLWDANNVPIQERVVRADRIGDNYVPLAFYVPAGLDYKLMMVNIASPGRVFRNGNDAYPYPFTIDGLIAINRYTTNGTNTVTTFSSPLYDWHISQVACLSDPQPYTVSVKIPLDIELDQYACESFTLSTGLSLLDHEWSLIKSPGNDSLVSSLDSLFIPETGNYILKITADPTCIYEDTLRVEIPRTAGLPNDGILCGSVLTTNYGNESEFLWSTGDTTPTLTLTMPDTISVTVFEPRGCVLTDTIFVTGFDSFPQINLGPDFASCVSASLNANFPNATYVWSNGDSTEQIEVFSSGVYTVEVINPNGCSGADTIGVLINPAPLAQFSPSITGFNVFFINQSTFGTYEWDFGDGQTSNSVAPFHVYQDTGVFVVRLITTNECGSDTSSQEIRIIDPSVSVEDASLGAFRLYPIPARNQVSIEWIGISGEVDMEVLDSRGKKVFTEQTLANEGRVDKISLELLPEGIYLLRIKDLNQRTIYNKRFVLIK
ncbi:MAG: PKD domain-containing protein [Bacteroidia bacterium]|nr:PKD domain-containing protein [Bacteroidia bacterium]